MTCACPWCNNEVQEGCESMMGQPTCFQHSWEAFLQLLDLTLFKYPEPR